MTTVATTRRSKALRRYVSEAIGTFFLVLVGPGTAMVNAWSGGAIGAVGVSLAFGFVVLAMIYTLGHVSGAHINPAVTLAFWSIRRFPTKDVPWYIGAQCSGAVAASLVLRGVLGPVGYLGATIPAIAVSGAFTIEFLLSFALMFVILAVATAEVVDAGFAPIAIGLTVGYCALFGGPVTGASMNPARSLGPAVAGGLWQSHWLYWLAPITGMLVAAQFHEWLRLPTSDGARKRRGGADVVTTGVEGPIL